MNRIITASIACLLGLNVAAASEARGHGPRDVVDARAIRTQLESPAGPAGPTLVLLTCGGTGVVGGHTLTCEAWLTSAPATDVVLDIALLGDAVDVAVVPPQVAVSAGQRKRTFPVVTRPVDRPVPITVSVSYQGESLATTRTVQPPGIEAFSLDQPRILGGSVATARVTLTGPAPAGGLPLYLHSSNEDLVPVPKPLLIPANATSVSFALPTRPAARSATVMLAAAVGPDPATARSFPVFVAHVPQPDIAILNWSFRDDSGVLAELPRGRAFQLCAEVANRSEAMAPPSRLRLLVLDSRGQELALEAPVESLAPGAQARPCFALPPLERDVNYSFNIYADYGDALRETNENNNYRLLEPPAPSSRPAPPAAAPTARPTPSIHEAI